MSGCTIVTSGHHGSIKITSILNNSITQKTYNRKYTWLPFLLLPPSGYSIWGTENCWYVCVCCFRLCCLWYCVPLQPISPSQLFWWLYHPWTVVWRTASFQPYVLPSLPALRQNSRDPVLDNRSRDWGGIWLCDVIWWRRPSSEGGPVENLWLHHRHLDGWWYC